MAQKVVGYREMIWTCPNCGAKNPGSVRVCRSCGAAMGEEVKFEQQTNAQMITDEKILQKAAQGPDIYCAYCGNRNPAGAKVCSRCGADLAEGKEREHGSQHSAHLDEHKNENAEPLICPACGTANPAGTLKCAACGTPLNVSTAKEEIPAPSAGNGQKKGGNGCLRLILILVVIGIVAMVLLNTCGGPGGGGVLNTGPTNTPVPNSFVNAVVSAQTWQSSVQVIGPVPARSSAWYDQVPDEAENIRCEDRLRHTYDDEVSGSVEVCGTPYAIDMGNGYEQFVQDCVYQVYEPYCEYTVYKAGVIDTRRASGSGPNPELPYVESGYSTGNQNVSYAIVLRDENGREYTLTPSGINEYRSYSVGDEFVLEVTASGRVVNMERK